MPSAYVPSDMTFVKKDLLNQYFQPQFIDNPALLGEFEVITDVKGEKELIKISPLDKITKGYKRGTAFTPSSGGAMTPRTLKTVRMKAEVTQTPDEFYATVYQVALAKGVDMNNLENSPELQAIVIEAFKDAQTRDTIRQAWLGDEKMETMVNTTGNLYAPGGTLDEHYSEYSGHWKNMIDEIIAGTVPAAQYSDINSSTYQSVVAVKGKKTLTFTGTSGTATVTINGRAYTATFATSLTVTATNFQAANAAGVLAKFGRPVLTNSGVTIIVEAGVPGMDVTVSIANLTGDLAGSVASTTAAVRNTTLVTGAGLLILQDLYERRTDELSAFDDTACRFDVTRSVYENVLKSLQASNTNTAAFQALVDGIPQLTYNGIPVRKRADWDKRINADFGGVQRHRASLSLPRNFVWGTDGEDDQANLEAWYERKEQLNYFRAQHNAGTQFVHQEYITAAY